MKFGAVIFGAPANPNGVAAGVDAGAPPNWNVPPPPNCGVGFVPGAGAGLPNVSPLAC